MFDTNYKCEPTNWRNEIPEGVDVDAVLLEPIEDWFEYAPEGHGTFPPEGCLAIESGLFIKDGEFLVSDNEKAAAAFFAERFVEHKLSPFWGDREKFAHEFALVKRFGNLNEPYRSVLLDAFVQLHNSKGQDVVSMTSTEFDEGKNASGYWSCVACVLPFLNLDFDPLCELLTKIIPKAKAGSYGWEIYGAVARLAEIQSELGGALLERIQGSPGDPLRCLLADVLVGLSRNDFNPHFEIAKQWVSSTDSELVSHGSLSIGAFDYSSDQGKPLLDDAITTLIELESNPSEEVHVSLVTAYGLLLHLDPRCIEGIERLSCLTNAKVKSRISHELFRQSREMEKEDWFRRVLDNLAEPCDDDIQTLDSLDFVVSGIAKLDAEYAMDFVERWLLNHDYGVTKQRTSFTKSFTSTLNGIQEAREDAYSHLVTRWFLVDDERLHRAASDLLEELAVRRINGTPLYMDFDKEQLSDLSYGDIQFILTKIIGFVHDKNASASLIFSLQQVQHQHDKVEELIVSVFRDVVGYNYPIGAYRFLNKKLETGSDTEKQLAQSCINRLDQYYDQLKALPNIREFQPPTLRVRQYDLAMHRMMNDGMDEAKSESVLLKLFPEVNLKYGRQAAFQIEGKTQVSTLHSFDQRAEISRGDMIDPVGMRRRRFDWRYNHRRSS